VLIAALRLVVGSDARGVRFWLGNLGGGSILGLALVWPLLDARANNGCTGVSDVYALTAFVTLFAVFLLGPRILGRCLLLHGSRHT
jgi:hypothetical protein